MAVHSKDDIGAALLDDLYASADLSVAMPKYKAESEGASMAAAELGIVSPPHPEADRIATLATAAECLLWAQGRENTSCTGGYQATAVGVSDDPRAAEAIELFVFRICRELGGLTAALAGLDGLVFTAGIGERSAEIRARVCGRPTWLGLHLDAAANAAGGPRITTPDSTTSAWVIATDEERMIARHTLAVLAAAGHIEAPAAPPA